MRLRQLRRGTAQHLVLLLPQPDLAAGFAQLGGLRGGHGRLASIFDVGCVQPVARARPGDPEVLRDFLDRSLTATGDGHDVAKLLG